MRIGIDARMLRFTGIGRHISSLVTLVPQLDPQNEYVIFLRPEDVADFHPSSPNVRVVETISSYYNLAEQTKHREILQAAQLDLLHVPHFNIPIRYSGRLVVTIHDLIQAKLPSQQTLKARLKRLGYRFVIGQALRKAGRIIAVSNFTKQDIVATFKTPADKIQVIHNGVDTRFAKKAFPPEQIQQVLQKYGCESPFLLYVGLHSPHKNLARLIQSLAQPPIPSTQNPHLLLVGKPDPRYTPQLQALTSELGLENRVHFAGFVPDDELELLYNAAAAFVFPSLYEGFGIPPLEALACGTPVISSHAASLPEVLGDRATYFDPEDVADIATKIAEVLPSSSEQGKAVIPDGTRSNDWADPGSHPESPNTQTPAPKPQFDWHQMAKETVALYRST